MCDCGFRYVCVLEAGKIIISSKRLQQTERMYNGSDTRLKYKPRYKYVKAIPG